VTKKAFSGSLAMTAMITDVSATRFMLALLRMQFHQIGFANLARASKLRAAEERPSYPSAAAE
jgi:hypothetical protein